MLANAQIGVKIAQSKAAQAAAAKNNRLKGSSSNSKDQNDPSRRHRKSAPPATPTRGRARSDTMSSSQRKALAMMAKHGNKQRNALAMMEQEQQERSENSKVRNNAMDSSRHSLATATASISTTSSHLTGTNSSSRPRSISLSTSLHGVNANKPKRPAPRLSAQAPKTLQSNAYDDPPLQIMDREIRTSERSIPYSITLQGNETDNTSNSLENDLEATAETILQDMVQAISILSMQEDDLTRTRKVHQERAQGRLDSGNTVGAMLSIKKWKRTQSELVALTQALDELENHHDALQGALIAEKLQGTTLLDDSENTPESSQGLADSMSMYKTIVAEVQEKLASNKEALDGNAEQPPAEEDALLQEFKDFCAPQK